jgi:hypothetical protein
VSLSPILNDIVHNRGDQVTVISVVQRLLRSYRTFSRIEDTLSLPMRLPDREESLLVNDSDRPPKHASENNVAVTRDPTLIEEAESFGNPKL